MEEDISAEELFFLLKKISLTLTPPVGRAFEKRGTQRSPGLFSGIHPETSSERDISHRVVSRKWNVKVNAFSADKKTEREGISLLSGKSGRYSEKGSAPHGKAAGGRKGICQTGRPDGDGDLRNSRSERERAVVGSGAETADQNGAQRKEYRQEDLLP